MLAYITATVASIIAATDRDSKFLEEKIYNINAFCKHRKIPTELRNRIIQNAMHQSRNSGIAVAWTSVMSELPQYIRYKITSEVFDDLLTMPFFRKLRLYGPIFEEFISSLEPEHVS